MTRRRPPVETADFARMVDRMLSALARRVADGDPADLADVLGLTARFELELGVAVRAMRDAHGYSWSQIGAAAGISKQAAQQRWGTAPERISR